MTRPFVYKLNWRDASYYDDSCWVASSMRPGAENTSECFDLPRYETTFDTLEEAMDAAYAWVREHPEVP